MVRKVGVVKDSKPRREINFLSATGKADAKVHFLHPIGNGKGHITFTLQEIGTSISYTTADELHREADRGARVRNGLTLIGDLARDYSGIGPL